MKRKHITKGTRVYIQGDPAQEMGTVVQDGSTKSLVVFHRGQNETQDWYKNKRLRDADPYWNKAKLIIEATSGSMQSCIYWLEDGDGDVMTIKELISEWRDAGCAYNA